MKLTDFKKVKQGQGQVNADNIFEHENTKLKKENQFLKNRFEQMQISYNELEKEIDEVKKHCEEELLETRTQFEKMKNLLEHSRENNNLLKRMSKIKLISSKIEMRILKSVQPQLQISQELLPQPTKKLKKSTLRYWNRKM